MSSDNPKNEFRKSLEHNLSSLISDLCRFDTNFDDISDEKLRKILSDMSQNIANAVEKLKTNLYFLQNNIEWNNFNIAFFGETNAGKSTLIEALTKGDGSSIGEGYKDFTKKVNNYKIGNITLLDMPGIEGDESKFSDEISKAISNSHVLFYVTEPKEPEEKTLQKIKNYLDNKTKVISVVNCRAKPGNYQLKKVLIDDNIRKVEQNTHEKLSNILKKNYEKNLTLNAYLGFLSVGNPKKEEFINNKKKCIEVFGSCEEAYKFSNLKEIENEIQRLYKQSNEEIVISNTYKILNEIENIISQILRDKKQFDALVKENQRQIEEKLDYANSRIDRAINASQREITIVLNYLRDEITEKIFYAIDHNYDEVDLDDIQDKVSGKYRKILERHISEIWEDTKKELSTIIKEIEQRISVYTLTNNLNFNVSINFSDIMKKIMISLDFIGQMIFNIISRILTIILAFAINPIIGFITTIISAVASLFDIFGSGRSREKAEKKKTAQRKINQEIANIKASVSNQFNANATQLRKQIEKIRYDIKAYLNKLAFLSKKINRKISDIYEKKGNICGDFIKYFNGNSDVSMAYLDLSLHGLVIVGNLNKYLDREKLRINTLKIYPTFDDMADACNIKINDGILYINQSDSKGYSNELIYRALSANIKKLNVKTIVRK